MEQARNTHKVRDLSIGFFGWFLAGSLTSRISNSLFIIPVVTIIVIVVLLFMKRNWLVYGLVAAVIANILGFLLLFGVGFGGGVNLETLLLSLIYGISYPFFMPAGYF